MGNTDKTEELRQALLAKGYDPELSAAVCKELHTDYTAMRMLGYLYRYSTTPSPEELVDEMLAILEERNAIMRKKSMEADNAAWNNLRANWDN